MIRTMLSIFQKYSYFLRPQLQMLFECFCARIVWLFENFWSWVTCVATVQNCIEIWQEIFWAWKPAAREKNI
jgi:hypothetical protein